MIRRHMCPRGSYLLLMSLVTTMVSLWALPSLADVVVLKDGRQFEGLVTFEDDTSTQFDTVISSVRAKLTLKRSDIESLVKQPLSADFFDSATDSAADAASQP